jgi:tRNA threonylcarbamoyladenosine biosynthesis protein TsaB
LLGCRETAEEGYSHAEKLHLFIEELLFSSNMGFSDLSAVAVSQGPGSYTGLRIGVSAAKGLCYALQIPMIAIDTLAVLAEQVQKGNGLIIPMIDARRMEVYCSVFDSAHQKVMETSAEIITEETFSEFDELVYFVGDATTKCKQILNRPNFIFLEEIIFPSAKEMVPLSWNKFKNADFVDLAYFEPLYLKDFVATTPKK